MKPICFLFLSVTRINTCLKQQRYQKKLQMTHSNVHCPYIGIAWIAQENMMHALPEP